MDIRVPKDRIYLDDDLAELTDTYPIKRVFGGIYHSVRQVRYISAAGLVYERELLYFFGHPIHELTPKQNYKLISLFGELAISAAKQDEWIGLHITNIDFLDFIEGMCVPFLDAAVGYSYIRMGINDSRLYVAPERNLVELISDRAKLASPLQLGAGQ